MWSSYISQLNNDLVLFAVGGGDQEKEINRIKKVA